MPFLLTSESESEDEPPKILSMKLRKWYEEYNNKRLFPLKDLSIFYRDNAKLDGLKEFQDKLKEDNFVIFTNHVNNLMYKDFQEIMTCAEKPFKTFILEDMKMGDRDKLEIILGKISKKKFSPHLFYQGKYIQSGRRLEKVYTNCEIERILELTPAVFRMDTWYNQ